MEILSDAARCNGYVENMAFDIFLVCFFLNLFIPGGWTVLAFRGAAVRRWASCQAASTALFAAMLGAVPQKQEGDNTWCQERPRGLMFWADTSFTTIWFPKAQPQSFSKLRFH